MGAVEKATMALRETGIPVGQRERLARIVLAAVGHEAAVAERNRYRAELGFIAEHSASAHHARLRARATLDFKP